MLTNGDIKLIKNIVDESITNAVNKAVAPLVTKEEAKNFATKDDLRSLTARVDHLSATTATKADVAAVKTDVVGIKADVAALKTDVGGLKTDVSALKTDVAGVKLDVSSLKTDVAGLKTDVSAVKTDVAVLKTDVAGVKLDVSSLKADVAATRADVSRSDTKLTKFDVKMSGQFADLAAKTTKDRERLEKAIKAQHRVSNEDFGFLENEDRKILTRVVKIEHHLGIATS